MTDASRDAQDPVSEFAARNGWDVPIEEYADFDLPIYVGASTFANLPWVSTTTA